MVAGVTAVDLGEQVDELEAEVAELKATNKKQEDEFKDRRGGCAHALLFVLVLCMFESCDRQSCGRKRETSGLGEYFEVQSCTRSRDAMSTWRQKSCLCIHLPDASRPDRDAKRRGANRNE